MTLDPTTWNLDVLNPNDVLEPVFQRLATQFNMSDYADSIYLSFKGLIAALRQQQAYFHLIRRSSISGFWQEIIQSTNMDAPFRRFICATLSIPYGSSIVESGFSVMNRLRGKVRWLLKPPAVQGLLWTKLNGPDLDKANIQKYSKIYLDDQKHLRCDSTHEMKVKIEQPPAQQGGGQPPALQGGAQPPAQQGGEEEDNNDAGLGVGYASEEENNQLRPDEEEQVQRNNPNPWVSSDEDDSEEEVHFQNDSEEEFINMNPEERENMEIEE